MGETDKRKDEQCLRVVKMAFTNSEFEFLIKNEEFAGALERCCDVDDIEKICILGHKLITDSPESYKLRRPN